MLRHRLLTGLLLLSCTISSSAATEPEEASRPNILFLFADDQSHETVHALGNERIETPTLDRLVAEGTTFTHCYNMGSWSGAVCVASRTMLNSGRFVWRAKAIHDTSEQERQAGRWWSEYLKQAGYRTYFTGKWHCKADASKAFDVVGTVRGGMPNQTDEGYHRPKSDGSDPWSPYDPAFGGYWKGGKHWSEVVADDAVDFLKQASDEEQPFFMYLAFNAPHDPRQSPKEYVDRYPTETIDVPSDFLPLYPYKDDIGLGPKLRDEKLATFPRTKLGVRVHRQEYYAIITHMDVQIGRILEALQQSGKADNTWIFFTADHGLACGHHGLMGKQNMYDHSLRVPFVAVGPSAGAAERISESIYLQDVMPTCLELAGVEKPNHVEFHSLLPMLSGQGSPYESIYGAYLDLQRCVRTDKFKLICYPEPGVMRLFDVVSDPHEMHDLASDPDYQQVRRELFERLLDQQQEQADELDLRSIFER